MVDSEIKKLEFLAGGGEMGERIRQYNWDETSLGNPAQWPQSLKTCVRIMLSSKQPIWIGWGHQLVKLYNDAYIDIVRGKHPIALGQPASVVWKDIWKDIEPLLSRAMNKDEGTYVESQLLIMERSGFPEETYYTFSYTPVLGADGLPSGIICYNTADTERIINERALRTMQQLDTVAQKKNEQEVYAQATKALSGNPRDFPFSLIYKIKNDGSSAEIVAYSGFAEKPVDGMLDLRDGETVAAGRLTAITENHMTESPVNGRWQEVPKGDWDVPPRVFVDIPIKSATRQFPLAVLTVGLNPYRKFDDAYRNFIQMIADQIALGVSNTLAYEEERKRAEALEALDKAKTLFFTNISHEFRTPLMLILGPLEELLKKPGTALTTAEKQSIELTHRNALRLLKLVNSLLDFSRIESGRHLANFVLTDLATYTQNLAANFRSVIERADLQFHVNTDEQIPPVYLDRQMWEKIVFNLLSNAFKYTLEGTISVDVYAKEGNAVLTVRDTGVGIPESELPHMFERFHRVQNTGGRTYEGTGIGLSLIKELVRLHQGTIQVESVEGEGSCFTVSIPLGKGHLPVTQILEDNPSFEIPGADAYLQEVAALVGRDKSSDKDGDLSSILPEEADELVLIVDDNADMRQHIQSLIATKYRTITATNGLDALEKMQKYKPTLILSDIMMPEVDGIELLKRVKANPETSQLPVILITARAGEDSKIEGYEIGADDYLVKPFSANEMLARIKSQIKINNSRKKIFLDQKSFTDKLEQKVQQRTEDLVKANKELESFNYIASHDLQEPLRKIQTFIHLIQKNKQDEKATQVYYDKISSSAQRMSDLIQSLLTYSRLAKIGEGHTLIDMNKIVKDIEIDFELLIAEKQAVIKCVNLPVIKANGFQINQLFSNLISNSLKFSTQSPEIVISSEIVKGSSVVAPTFVNPDQPFYQITFSDNGIGFEQEFSEKIFSLFQRLHGKHEYSGTGIGLSIVKKIVEQHEGYIAAESSLGNGAVFHIWLPV
ncbi:ATP-binding protein [Dyadobacter chenwenxiniae]|uniref:histidine kinase n=1 Tax=Dyadobacter chenwenxiniae TaxID=2906456 RepID=A0A9X1PK97_9BACT|nr:ATP-binding protein [Dyadobacter chenwenxiniae]MCF0062882.1 ATP-binding protein [Dyadobacter chenwenxiniae]UON84943.1 ATP-binding protein [Dyadobacter chenwenxiniae]